MQILGHRDYGHGPPMVLWNPYFNRFQLCRPGFRINAPIKDPTIDYANIHLLLPLRSIFDGGFVVIRKFAEVAIAHPFLVVRRQCQVNVCPKIFHVLPHTLLPAIYHLHKNQGMGVLWKGFGSVLLLQGISHFVEKILVDHFFWPKDIDLYHTNVEQFLKHIQLKWCIYVITAPYYASALAKTVCSGPVHDAPSALDILGKGTSHLFHWSTPRKMFPIWYIAITFSVYQVSKHVVVTGLRQSLERCIFRRRNSKLQLENVLYIMMEQDRRFYCYLFSSLIMDFVLYPAETLMHRLFCQGAGVTIDNLDTGYTLQTIYTSFEGIKDCWFACCNLHGNFSFYEGIGTLFFHYGSLALFMRLARYAWIQTWFASFKKYIFSTA